MPDVVPVELAPRAETLPFRNIRHTACGRDPGSYSTETPRVSETPEASDRLYALPTKRPAQQNVEAPDAESLADRIGEFFRRALPFKTLALPGLPKS